MTITQLQYVLAVAEHRNFTQAAQRTHVTQPTLSMQIQKLEEELDVQIFDRSKKPIQVTDIGRSIIEQARKVVNEASRMNDIVDQQKGYIGGPFRIGIIPTIMPTLLPMFLRNFINRYPKVNLLVEERTTEEIMERLQDGRLDAALAATPLENPHIEEQVLYYEPFVAYVPHGHRMEKMERITPEDLDLDDMLLLEDGHCFRDGVINLCKIRKLMEPEQFQLDSGSFETLIKLSDEGLGMTLLPYLTTQDLNEEEKKRLRYFSEPVPAREVSLLYSDVELKLHIVEALSKVINGVVRGAIAFHNVQIISPLNKKW